MKKKPISDLRRIIPNLDGLVNVVSGLGVQGRDKRMANTASHRPLTETECDDIYAAFPIARKIVDKLPEESLRRGIEFTGMEPDLTTQMNDYISKLQIIENTKLGLQWGRKYGGAAGLLGVNDGLTLDKPLDLSRIYSLDSIIILNRWELYAQSTDRITNIKDPDYGWPRYYTLISRRGMNAVTYGSNGKLPADVINSGVKIHYSRLVRFDGVDIGPRKRSTNGFWNDSFLTGLEDSIKDYNSSNSSAAALVHDFNIAVMTLADLKKNLGAKKEDDIKAAIELLAYCKSILGIMLIGEGDAFEVKTRSVTGLSDIIDKVKDFLAAQTEYPHTALFNETPGASLGEGGSSQQSNFYDVIQGYQETTIPKALDRFLTVAFAAKDGPTNGVEPEGWSYEFPALEQTNETEQATAMKTRAEADDIYVGMGADPKAILRQRFSGQKYQVNIHLEDADILDAPEPPAPVLAPPTPDAAQAAAKEAKSVMDVLLDSSDGREVLYAQIDKKTFPMVSDAERFLVACDIAPGDLTETRTAWIFGKPSSDKARAYSPMAGVRIVYGKADA